MGVSEVTQADKTTLDRACTEWCMGEPSIAYQIMADYRIQARREALEEAARECVAFVLSLRTCGCGEARCLDDNYYDHAAAELERHFLHPQTPVKANHDPT